MIEASLWHPVARADDLAACTRLAVTLLEEPVVLWREAGGTPHAWADRCPHRGARLSLGMVQGDKLQCAYHGWRFDGSGQAIVVPARPEFVPSATHHACTYAAQERYGMVWVRLARDEPGSEIPAFAAEDDARLRKLSCGPFDVAASAPRIVENFLDMAHFGFVHEGWLGAREHTAVEPYDVTATPTGLLATGCKAWQPRSSVQAQGGAQVEYTYEVTAPYSAVLTKLPEPGSVAIAGFREAIALFICPVTPETSRVWFRLAVGDFESPDASLQDFQRTIFMQDRPVLESQSPKRLPISDAAATQELHSAADRAATAYRRHLRERGIRFGVC